MAWTILAHEYAHSIDDSRKISNEIVHNRKPLPGTTEDNRRMQVRWVAEIVADFVAARVLGPASLIPILFVEMARSTLGGSSGGPSHPPTPVRLRLAHEYLATLDVGATDFEKLFEVYEFDYAQKLRKIATAEKKKREAIRKAADSLLSPLAPEIANRVRSLRMRSFGKGNADRARRLQAKLKAGLPISSRRDSGDREILAKLGSLTETSPTRTVYAALEMLNELPAASSEIIAAGWLYRLSSFHSVLLQTFPGRRAKLGIYGDYLERTDSLLLKSLELAAVHHEMNSAERQT